MRRIIFNSRNRIRPIWRIAIFLLVTFILNIPLQLGLHQILDKSILRGCIGGAIYLTCVVFSLFVQVKFIEKSSFKQYGLAINKVWIKEFGVGVGISIVQLLIFFGVMHLTGNLNVIDFFTVNTLDYSFEFSFWEGFFAEVLSMMVGSSVEEIFFRAFLFYMIYEALRVVKQDVMKRALLTFFVIAPFFGLAHMANEGATVLSTVNLALDALIVCLPFLITGRLGMSIGMHFSWNFVQGVVLGFAVSGNTTKVSVIDVTMPDNLLTGGVFGPEGSILMMFIGLPTLLFILYWKNRNSYKSFVSPIIVEHAIT